MPIELGSFSFGAIAGGIVIGIANHYLSKSRNKEEREITEFNKAAFAFRDAFLQETTFLKNNTFIPGGERTYTTLNEYLFAGYVHRHLKSFEVFRKYLSSIEMAGIDKAWQKYCKHPDDPKVLYFEQYSTKNVSKEREKELKDLALQRIEEILKFAKHK